MALLMTRECGLGPLFDNYIRISDIILRINETPGCFIDITITAYISKESRDFEKMKKYIIDNTLIPTATNQKQADYLNCYWNKPDVTPVAQVVLTCPVKLSEIANKSREELYSFAYLSIVERRSALGFKQFNSSNILENHIETEQEFAQRVVDPFIANFKALA